MKILIFGASGMLGTELINVCKQKNINYIALTHEDIEATNDEELKSAIEKYNPTIVVNCIAIVGINPCEKEPVKAYNINTLVPYNIAKICDSKNILMVHISTHAVFDGNSDNYYSELDVPNPLNIYGITKYSADILVANYCKKYYIFRVPTMYGKRKNKSFGFVEKMINLMEKNDNIAVADDKIDTPTYAYDVALKIIEIIKNKFEYGLYHIANSYKVSYYDFICYIKKVLGLECIIKRAKDSDFESFAKKPLKTSLISVKIAPLRKWQSALQDYLINYKG